MEKKCLVRDCPNYSNQGRFIGDLCAPCHEAISKGVATNRFMISRLIPWKPIETAPYDKLVLVTGPSGMSGVGSPDYQMTGYRVKGWHEDAFNTNQGTRISDGNQEPTHWREIA